MRAAIDREVRAKRLQDGRTYTLAQLIAYAANNPKRMPRFEKAFPDGKPKKAQSADEIHALMVSWVETMDAMKGAADG